MADRLEKIASGEFPNDLGVTIELLSALELILSLHQSTADSSTWVD